MLALIFSGCASLEASAPPSAMEAGAAQDLPEASVVVLTADAERKDDVDEERPASAPGEPPEERVRAWFPETFLWRPLVETDANGAATVEVAVPDSLTTWRVLALAHDRAGQQAGDVATFDSTLPVYVDPAVPGWMYAGDRLLLPVRVTNATDLPVRGAVEVGADGALVGVGLAAVALGPRATNVRYLPVQTIGAGTTTIRARLSAGALTDAAQRSVPVLPAGRPVTVTRSGSLAGTRAFALPAVPFADPTTERIEVRVFSGPQAVLQSELERLAAGGRPENPAYTFALAAALRAPGEPESPPLRRARLQAHQRLVYAGLAPDAGLAADLLALLPRDEPHTADIADRLVTVVTGDQRADGTWSRADLSTLQQVLVQTAFAGRALPEDHAPARLRAAGALERNFDQVDDPYTAAMLVASGLLDADLANSLRALVSEGLLTDPLAGVQLAELPPNVRNVWGLVPTSAERFAWACLALPADDPVRLELAGRLLAGWSATSGFGAGRADGIVLEAVAGSIRASTGPIEVSLSVDGAAASTARFEPTSAAVPVLLTARGGRELALSVQPATAGLVFVATRRAWVPWGPGDRLPGVDVRATLGPLGVGRSGALTIGIAAPAGAAVHLEQGLPAGVFVEQDVHANAEAIGARVQVLPDRVIVETRPFAAGEVQSLVIPVIPAFAGRFQTAPLLVGADGDPPVAVRPAVWLVSP